MKVNMKKIALGLILTGGVTGHALAVNTAAGTDINNRATLTFDTSQTTGTVVESSSAGNSDTGVGNGEDTTFQVDRKLDVEILKLDATLVAVAPGDWAGVQYQVTNNGNDVQDVLLTLTELSGGSDPDAGNDDNNTETGTLKLCSDAPDASGSCTALADDAVKNLAVGASQTVYVVAQMQDAASVSNAQQILVSVLGQVAYASDGSNDDMPAGQAGVAIASDAGETDDIEKVQDVFADAAGPGTDGAGAGDVVYDGYHSDIWGFVIVEANISITKEAIAVWDPFSCDTDSDPATAEAPPTAHDITCTNPKAIPGAYLEYTITVVNAVGAALAENISISDLLQDTADADFVADAYNDDSGTCTALTPCGIYVVQPFTTGDPEPAGQAHTNAADLDGSDYSATAADTVTSAPNNLAGGQTTIVKFRVEIQ